MRQIFQLFLLISICMLLSNCSIRSEHTRILTASDSLWLDFANAMEQRNMKFLITNSLYSIRCIDCEPNNLNRENEVYEAKYLFNNFLSELMHLNKLATTEFSTYQDSTLIRVNYKIEHDKVPEGVYNLIFTLEQRHGKYYLVDRFFVP